MQRRNWLLYKRKSAIFSTVRYRVFQEKFAVLLENVRVSNFIDTTKVPISIQPQYLYPKLKI